MDNAESYLVAADGNSLKLAPRLAHIVWSSLVSHSGQINFLQASIWDEAADAQGGS